MYMQIKCKHQAHGKVPNYPLVLQRLGWLAGRCSDCKWGWAVPKAGLLRRNRKRINPAVTCHFKRSWGAIEKSAPDAVRSAIITEQWAPLSFSRQHPQEILLCNQGKRCNQARIQPSFRNSPCRQHKGFSMVLCEVGDQRLGSATTSRVNALLSTSSVHLSSESPEGVLEEGWEFRPKYTCNTVLHSHCPHLWQTDSMVLNEQIQTTSSGFYSSSACKIYMGKVFLVFFPQKYECICDDQILQEPHSLGSRLIPQRLMRFIRGEDVSEFSFHV